MTMKHLVNVSGGAGSGVALFRAIERYGRENVSARLADTNSEHPDLYRFVDELEREAGITIARLKNDGLTIWDVFFREMMLTSPGTGGCIASWHLKKLPLRIHADTVGTPEDTIIHVGFSIDEDDRIERIKIAGAPWQFDFPLTWKPALARCDVMDYLRGRGVEPCITYEQGYPHANCSNRCILQGIGGWAGVLKDDPAGYAEDEEREQRFMAELERRGRKVVTILKDRRGGDVKNLSLRQLREEIESGTRKPDYSWRESSCSCVGTLFEKVA